MHAHRCAIATLALLALPLLAEETAETPSYGFRRLVASPSQNGEMTEITIEGECSFPDDTSLDIFLEHRGQKCEGLLISVYPKGGLFTARMSTMKKMLPGHYVVKAQFTAARQDGEVLNLLRNVPEKNAIQAFAIGDPAQIKAIRDEQLKMYEGELGVIEKSFDQMAESYVVLLKKYDMRESPLEWNRKFGNISADCQVAIERLKTAGYEAVIPVFPLLDSWTIEGWGLLAKMFNQLTEGLTIEITEAMSRKGTDRHYFLKSAKQEMANFLQGMRAQITLERKLEQRESLVNDCTELSRLYEESSNTYEQAKQVRSEEVTKAWQEFMTGQDGKGGWRGDLKAITKRVNGYRGGDLEKDYKELVDLLTGAPASLAKLWDLYDRVMMKGENEEQIHTQVKEALDDCYLHIYPVMEVLGFNREVFNRLMGRYQGAPEDGAPEDPVTGTMTDYIRAQVEKLDSADPLEAAKAMQVLLKLETSAKKTLKDLLAKGGIENPKVVGLMTICLGRLGEKSVAPDLIFLLHEAQYESIRLGAAMALGHLGGMEMVSPLTKALSEDESAAVRSAAANAIALLHQPTAIPDLLKALMDEDIVVRQAAISGAESLAKIDFPFDPGASEERRKKDQQGALEWWEANRERLLNPEPEPEGGGAGDGK